MWGPAFRCRYLMTRRAFAVLTVMGRGVTGHCGGGIYDRSRSATDAVFAFLAIGSVRAARRVSVVTSSAQPCLSRGTAGRLG